MTTQPDAPRPLPGSDLTYDAVITCHGVTVPFVPALIPPRLERPLRAGRYRAAEAAVLSAAIRPGDRVLDLTSGGVGLCATIAARTEGVARVISVPTDPARAALMRETHRLSGAGRVELHSPAPMSGDAGPTPPALAALIADLRPTLIRCDLNGGELALLGATPPDLAPDLTGVRAVIVTLNPRLYGDEGVARIAAALGVAGLLRDTARPLTSAVQIFTREAGFAPTTPPSPMPRRTYRTGWPLDNPRTAIVTCMKDEGPFILEWLAWHRAIGVTDFIIFTNDCSDGTDALLDHLDDRGIVTHLPNPAMGADSSYFQPYALRYAHYLRPFRQADFVISMDVDEFINIRAGGGRLADLFAATGPFDMLSMNELNHGSNDHVAFAPGWVTAQFPAHQPERVGRWRARRGVKTITRLSPRINQIRNHRPDRHDDDLPVLWLDGSGRYLASLQADASQNGTDSRGCYDHVVLDHYALRSAHSYLMKMLRGDVVIANKSVSLRYWRLRNQNGAPTSQPHPAIMAAAQDAHERLFQGDAALMALHHGACDWHSRRIAQILQQPRFADRLAAMLDQSGASDDDSDDGDDGDDSGADWGDDSEDATGEDATGDRG